MKHDHFVVQSPDKPAQQLLLLFHGVGDNPVAMGEIGNWFAPLFPDALVVSVGARSRAVIRRGVSGFRCRVLRKIIARRVWMRSCRRLLKRCATGRNRAE